LVVASLPTATISSLVPSSGTSAPASMQPQTVQEFQRMLEETKKEVREIRAIEAQMRWNMAREEIREKTEKEAAALDDIRDWRWKQSDEMKQYVADKAHRTKVEELQESKGYQEFKREVKTLVKEEDLKVIQENYQKDMSNAQWRAEMEKERQIKEKEIVVSHAEEFQFLRDARSQQKIQEKAEQDERRALEQNLEMANMAKELAREKEKLLQSLQYVRSCQKPSSVCNGRGSTRPSAVLGVRHLPANA